MYVKPLRLNQCIDNGGIRKKRIRDNKNAENAEAGEKEYMVKKGIQERELTTEDTEMHRGRKRANIMVRKEMLEENDRIYKY